MKDKLNVHVSYGMSVQEEVRLNNKGTHSINLVSHQGVEKKGKKHAKEKQRYNNVNESFSQVYKKEHNNDKCHFCGKSGNIQKDCLKFMG